MIRILLICFTVQISSVFCAEQFCYKDENGSGANDKFSEDFKFGASTSAYQIEGGWDADGKGPSVWDTFLHKFPKIVEDGSNGDNSSDSYNLFHEDLKALKELKVDFYRFSISWSRILPLGDISSRNELGLSYYDRLIDNLLANRIEPMVTMHHFDMPYELHKLGGFMSPIIIDYFREYANLLFSRYGHKVKYWLTFNEPVHFCIPAYSEASHPPLIDAPGIGEYLCADHLLKAHAVAYRLYKEQYYENQRGQIGIALSSRFYYSRDNNSEHAERGMQYTLGWLAHPIFSPDGGYPQIMIDDIDDKSIHERRAWSRLPILDGYWKKMLRGSADFLGLNYYTSRYLEPRNDPVQKPSWEADFKMKLDVDPSWKRGKSSFLYSVPKGLGDLLRWIKIQYNNVEIFITENGWSDDGQLDDDDRITFIMEHLSEVKKAINEDGCNVSGYFVWSLLDNFEWNQGYSEKFGLYRVNFTSPNKERTAKKSALFYKRVIETKELIKCF